MHSSGSRSFCFMATRGRSNLRAWIDEESSRHRPVTTASSAHPKVPLKLSRQRSASCGECTTALLEGCVVVSDSIGSGSSLGSPASTCFITENITFHDPLSIGTVRLQQTAYSPTGSCRRSTISQGTAMCGEKQGIDGSFLCASSACTERWSASSRATGRCPRCSGQHGNS
jgi:hypothetical protein